MLPGELQQAIPGRPLGAKRCRRGRARGLCVCAFQSCFSGLATSGLKVLFSCTQRDTQLIFSLSSPSGPGPGHT